MSFRDDLTPEENAEFAEWARHQRETNLKGMAESAMVLSIYPGSDFDIDYALQIGACILFEKPLLVLAQPGMELPAKLRLIADEVIEVSSDAVDTSAPELAAKVLAFMERHA